QRVTSFSLLSFSVYQALSDRFQAVRLLMHSAEAHCISAWVALRSLEQFVERYIMHCHMGKEIRRVAWSRCLTENRGKNSLCRQKIPSSITKKGSQYKLGL